MNTPVAITSLLCPRVGQCRKGLDLERGTQNCREQNQTQSRRASNSAIFQELH